MAGKCVGMVDKVHLGCIGASLRSSSLLICIIIPPKEISGKYWRVWCNGNMSISKIVDRGSIPFTLENVYYKRVINLKSKYSTMVSASAFQVDDPSSNLGTYTDGNNYLFNFTLLA